MSSANDTASTSPLFVSSLSRASPSSVVAASASSSPPASPSASSPPASSPRADSSSAAQSAAPASTPSAQASSAAPSSASPFSSQGSPSSAAASSAASQPASSPVSVASSQAPASSAAASSAAASSAKASSAAASSAAASSAVDATSVVTASSKPPTTQIITSLVTPSATAPGETPTPSVVVITVISSAPAASKTDDASRTTSPTATGTSPTELQGVKGKESNGGLGKGGKTAVAVVVPVVVVALLVIAGILLWRRRKNRKNAEEARRKEVEEYGFNPNNDPTLPAVGAGSEMAEDQSGYRGWGNTTASSNRKASTTLTSGQAYSDSTSNPGGYQSPHSPTYASDSHSHDPLMHNQREMLDGEGISALGAAPMAGQKQNGVHRGTSNASSSYSAANRSSSSGDYPLPNNSQQDYYPDTGYYNQHAYNDGYGAASAQPIIRDVSARRNTRIENPSVFPQQGNSGIAQNF